MQDCVPGAALCAAIERRSVLLCNNRLFLQATQRTVGQAGPVDSLRARPYTPHIRTGIIPFLPDITSVVAKSRAIIALFLWIQTAPNLR